MIKDILENGGEVNSSFMIKNVAKAMSNGGSYYLTLTLQDNSGTLEARKWSLDDSDAFVCVPGKIVRIEGQLLDYRGHPQLKIIEIEPIEDSQVKMEKFIPTAPVDFPTLKNRLQQLLDMIVDNDYKKLTSEIIQNRYDDYITYPAAATIHHAYLHGLLYHSVSICNSAVELSKIYTILNRDVLICGSLLHDIGKLDELSGIKATEYTTEGNLIGHISKGAIIVYNEGKRLNIPTEKIDVITHIILSHHGKYEFGSPKLPQTPEAIVISHLDEIDAKLETLRVAYQGVDDGCFTNRISALDGLSFYKSKS